MQSSATNSWEISNSNPLGAWSARVRWQGTDQNEVLFSPYFSIQPSSFTFATKGSLTYCGGAPGGYCDLKVWLVRGNWDGGVYDDVLLGYADEFWPADATWVTATLNITASLNNLPSRIAFQYVGNQGDNAYIDNITINP